MKVYALYMRLGAGLYGIYATKDAAQRQIDEWALEEYKQDCQRFIKLLEKNDKYCDIWQPDIARCKDKYWLEEMEVIK